MEVHRPDQQGSVHAVGTCEEPAQEAVRQVVLLVPGEVVVVVPTDVPGGGEGPGPERDGPPAGARVEVSGENLQRTGITGQDGRLRLSLPAGSYDLQISLAGFDAYHKKIVIFSRIPAELTATLQLGAVQGALVDVASPQILPIIEEARALDLEAIPVQHNDKPSLWKRTWRKLFKR